MRSGWSSLQLTVRWRPDVKTMPANSVGFHRKPYGPNMLVVKDLDRWMRGPIGVRTIKIYRVTFWPSFYASFFWMARHVHVGFYTRLR